MESYKYMMESYIFGNFWCRTFSPVFVTSENLRTAIGLLGEAVAWPPKASKNISIKAISNPRVGGFFAKVQWFLCEGTATNPRTLRERVRTPRVPAVTAAQPLVRKHFCILKKGFGLVHGRAGELYH